jgi:hypothetical protein
LYFPAFTDELDKAHTGLDSESVRAADTQGLRNTQARKETERDDTGMSLTELLCRFDYRWRGVKVQA